MSPTIIMYIPQKYVLIVRECLPQFAVNFSTIVMALGSLVHLLECILYPLTIPEMLSILDPAMPAFL